MTNKEKPSLEDYINFVLQVDLRNHLKIDFKVYNYVYKQSWRIENSSVDKIFDPTVLGQFLCKLQGEFSKLIFRL